MELKSKTTITIEATPIEEHLIYAIKDLIELDSPEAALALINAAIQRRLLEQS